MAKQEKQESIEYWAAKFSLSSEGKLKMAQPKRLTKFQVAKAYAQNAAGAACRRGCSCWAVFGGDGLHVLESGEDWR
jgi:hypothetical protein